MPDEQDRISLKTAIASLRKELTEAATEARRLGPHQNRFRILTVEVELTVGAEDSTNLGGEVGWWLFKATGSFSDKDIATQKVKLILDVGSIEVNEPIEED